MQLLTAVLLALAPISPASPAPTLPSPAAADTAHWSGTGDFAFTDVSGNKALSLLTTRLGVTRNGSRDVALSGSFGARYGRSEGEVVVEDYAAGLEARIRPKGRFSPFVTSSAARDDIKLIDLRLAVAAGVDLNLVTDSVRRIAVGVALLQDRETVQLEPDSLFPDAASSTTSSTRFNLRLNGKLPLRSGVEIEHSSTFQPVADDLGDYLFVTESTLRVLLSRRLAFQTVFAFNRDSSPAAGVLFRNDRTLTIGLRVRTS